MPPHPMTPPTNSSIFIKPLILLTITLPLIILACFVFVQEEGFIGWGVREVLGVGWGQEEELIREVKRVIEWVERRVGEEERAMGGNKRSRVKRNHLLEEVDKVVVSVVVVDVGESGKERKEGSIDNRGANMVLLTDYQAQQLIGQRLTNRVNNLLGITPPIPHPSASPSPTTKQPSTSSSSPPSFSSPSFLSHLPHLSILIKPAHLSQLDQNHHSKLLHLHQHPNDNIYAEQIMEELKRMNKGGECLYERNHVRCREMTVFVVGGGNGEGKGQDKGNRGEKREGPQQAQTADPSTQFQRQQQQQPYHYWITQDQSIALLSLHQPLLVPLHQSSDPSSSPKNTQDENQKSEVQMYGLSEQVEKMLTEIVLEQVGLREVVMWDRDRGRVDVGRRRVKEEVGGREEMGEDLSLSTKPLPAQPATITLTHTFLLLTSLHRHLHHLSQLLSALTARRSLPYRPIPQHTLISIRSLLSSITSLTSPQPTITSYNSTTITQQINDINQIDTFPADYKLGVLLPVAVVLGYPVVGWGRWVMGREWRG